MYLWTLLACTNPDLLKGGSLEGSQQEGSDGSGTAGTDPLESTGLQSLGFDEDTTECESASEAVGGAAGAKSYFTGTYLRDGSGGWIGREKWILFPTELWGETDGEPCEVVWETTAYEGEVLTCLACSFALHVSAVVNEATTTCPQLLWNLEGELEWEERYEVAIIGEQALFYFQDSGSIIGEGYANSQAASFLSEASCVWF
jgi:hypothetical protein